MLLCYPRDPGRRNAWLKTVRDSGLEPTNTQFICELHFGPDQWEKIRVDGKKKLKWSGVPNVLEPWKSEAAGCFESLGVKVALSPAQNADEKLSTIQLQELTEQKRIESPNIPRKVMKFSAENQTAHATAKLMSSTSLVQKTVNSEDLSSQEKANSFEASTSECNVSLPVKNSMKVVILGSTVDPNEVQQYEYHSEGIEAASPVPQSSPPQEDSLRKNLLGGHEYYRKIPPSNDRLRKDSKSSLAVCQLPLSSASHSIIVKLPKSRFQNSLMEDLEDVRSFLRQERTYEERLVSALSELIKKHELLDRKIEAAEATYADNCALKEKLRDHQKILVENYSLKEKIHSYETKAIVESVIFREKSCISTKPIIKVENVESDQGALGRALEDQL